MTSFVDDVLNRVTMYRLVLYYLIFLLGGAILLSAFGLLGYDPFAILFTTGFLLAACSITNWVFARTFEVPANAESTRTLMAGRILPPIKSEKFSDGCSRRPQL